MHVCFLQWFLQFAHSTADHRTRAGAGRENEIGYPNLSDQLRRTERLSILIRELKAWNCAIRFNRTMPQVIHLASPDKEEHGRDDEWYAKKDHSPDTRAGGCRPYLRERSCVHNFVRTRVPSKRGR